jgi:hypothetical protein
MIDLEGHVRSTAIPTAPPELFQKIRPDFPSKEVSMLVQRARDLRVLHHLRVKRDAFRLNACQGNPALIPFGPGHHIPNAGSQGWWKPTRRATPIEEPGSTIAQIGTSAPSAIPSALLQRGVDCLAPMVQVRQVQRVMDRTDVGRRFTDQGHAGSERTRIKFEHDGLHDALVRRAVSEPDGKGHESMHHRSRAGQQQPCAFF